MKRIIIFMATAFFCFVVGNFQARDASAMGQQPAKSPGPAPSGFAPDFNLKDMQGKNVRLSDFRGKKAVLLVFSTTWCPHCRKQVPEINKIYSKYKSKGLEVFHVDIEEPPDRIAAFIKRYKVQYPVLLDRTGKVAEQYKIVGVPANVFIDKTGKIVCNPCQSVEKNIPSVLQSK